MKHEETWKTHWHHTQMCEDNLCWVCWLSPINQKCSLLPPQGHCSACCPSQRALNLWTSFIFFHQFSQFDFEKSTRFTQWNHFSCFVHFFPSQSSYPLLSLYSSVSELCLSEKGWEGVMPSDEDVIIFSQYISPQEWPPASLFCLVFPAGSLHGPFSLFKSTVWKSGITVQPIKTKLPPSLWILEDFLINSPKEFCFLMYSSVARLCAELRVCTEFVFNILIVFCVCVTK